MKRIIIIALIPLFYFADANGVDKNTKAIYDSIVKYFVSVSQNKEEQDCIKLNIQEYGEDFTRIFNISDFLNNNTPYNDKDLNREFGIYFIQHKYNKCRYKVLFHTCALCAAFRITTETALY